jgi:RNA polymerase sigma-70 factor (ECF subfamily)
MAAASDHELLQAWRTGDTDAGRELFERHFAALYRFFRNKVDDGVEDLIQETLLACTESRDQFRGDASFRTYLFTVARNALYAYWRQRRRDGLHSDVADCSVEALATSPSGKLARKRERRLLLRALRALPLELQTLLELHYWEDLPGPELARVLGIPEGTVRSRLRRARTALEAAMTQLADGPERTTLSTSLANLDDWARSLRPAIAAG